MICPRFQLALGRFANWLGWPSLLRECDYTSHSAIKVKVRHGALYTVVHVDGIDVYFHRFTGKIDGHGYAMEEGHALDLPRAYRKREPI